jgi:hypothetical protein
MVNAILSLITNSLISGFAIIGIGTFINKVGKFFKIIEDSSNDGYKKGFDAIMIDSMDEMNRCVESVNLITINFNKIFLILYDIVSGNKYIKKDKDGKIIICTKSKMYSGYKNKIEELSSKVKKYENELKKFKRGNNNEEDDDKSKISDDSYSSVSDSDLDSSLDDSINEKIKLKSKKNIQINTLKQQLNKNKSNNDLTAKNIDSDYEDEELSNSNSVQLNNDDEFFLESDET